MTTTSERTALFADGLRAAQGELAPCRTWDDIWQYAISLSDETPVVAPAAYAHLQQGELPDEDEPLRSIADRSVGITVATLAVAETGSVLLLEPAPIDRAVSLLTRHLIVAVAESDIVDELSDGFRWLAQQPRAAAYATFVTGPSRTADIERSLTIGVQGPSRLMVAVLA